IDPRLGRMVIDAGAAGCLREVITIAAALSMQDPRERPVEQRELADAKHRRFADKTSDFAGILNLWAYLKEQQAALSSSAFRRLCRTDFLNYLRIREWQELDTQLRQASKQLGLPLNSSPGTAEAIHRSLLAGLLSHIGVHDPERRDYLGARGARFAIFPGSALFKSSPAFVMAAELVETGRLWARVNAAVQPEWMESVGAHLVKRSYSEPHWEKKRGGVVALEKVTLYGVPIVTGRKVDYGRIDPETARDLFIRHALVQGEWQTHHRFWRSNQELLTEAEQLEHRARRRDIVVDEETLYELYDERVPEQVVSVAHFDSWWKRQRRRTPDLLTFTLDMLTHDTAADVAAEDYPDVWRLGQAALPLSYEFDPGSDADGVTVDIPVTALPGVEEEDFSWPVPGLREELVVALIRSLPKRLRVSFVPAPDHARTFLHSVTPGDQPLLDALERHLLRTTGVALQRSDWDLAKVPAHLRTRFRVRSDDGQVIGQGRRLDELRKALRPHAAAAVSAAAAAMGIERSGLVSWDFDRLPDVFEQTRAGHEVTGYPALVDEGDSVAIMVLSTAAEQEAATRRGVRRLLLLANPSPVAAAVRRLDNQSRLSLGLAPHATTGHLLDDCSACAIDRIAGAAAGRLREREAFEALREMVQQEMGQALDAVLRLVLAALVAAHAVDRRLSGRADLRMLPALTDLKAQWSRLVYPGFVAEAGAQALRHYPRYFAAMEVRLDKLAVDPRGDAVRMASMAGVQASYLNHIDNASPDLPLSDELSEVRWMLEELRVSIWAQQLTTARSVSVPRVERALATP
ncbi:MAG: ATP-dependent RNA helicase HrpA, partial [Nocardioidaceae bacterium]